MGVAASVAVGVLVGVSVGVGVYVGELVGVGVVGVFVAAAIKTSRLTSNSGDMHNSFPR